MKNTSRGINFHSGVQHLDPSISVPQTWAENSNKNCQTSQGNLKIEKDIVKLQYNANSYYEKVVNHLLLMTYGLKLSLEA